METEPKSQGCLLRDVMENDLPTFFEHQRDPAANHMAAFAAKEMCRNSPAGSPRRSPPRVGEETRPPAGR